MLSRRPPPARLARARPAHSNQRPHAQRSAQDGRCAAQPERQDRHSLTINLTSSTHGRRNEKRKRPEKEAKPKPRRCAPPKAPQAEEAAAEAAKAPKKAPLPPKALLLPLPKLPSRRDAAPAGPAAAAAPTAAELLGDDLAGKKIVKAKGAKNITAGIANILATFNNTQVSITDMQGNVIGWSSAGRVGFKGSRKSTAYAAQQVAQDAARQAMSHGMREVEIRVKGPGSGRESAIRAFRRSAWKSPRSRM